MRPFIVNDDDDDVMVVGLDSKETRRVTVVAVGVLTGLSVIQDNRCIMRK